MSVLQEGGAEPVTTTERVSNVFLLVAAGTFFYRVWGMGAGAVTADAEISSARGCAAPHVHTPRTRLTRGRPSTQPRRGSCGAGLWPSPWAGSSRAGAIPGACAAGRLCHACSARPSVSEIPPPCVPASIALLAAPAHTLAFPPCAKDRVCCCARELNKFSWQFRAVSLMSESPHAAGRRVTASSDRTDQCAYQGCAAG